MESERGKTVVRNLVIGMLFITVITPLFMDTDRIPSFRPSAPRDPVLEDLMPLTVLADGSHLNALSTQETSFVLKELTGIVQSDRNGELGNVTIEDSADSQTEGSREHASSNVLHATISETRSRVGATVRQDPKTGALLGKNSVGGSLEGTPRAWSLNESARASPMGKGRDAHMNKMIRRTNQMPLSDLRVRQLRDQLIRAKVFLTLPAVKNNPHFTRELRLRIREVQRVLGDAAKDSQLPKSAHERLKAMEQTLEKGKKMQDDCPAVVRKLRAMLHSAEDQLRLHRKQAMFLTQLTAKTLPRGLHCLPLRLTTEFHMLHSSEQQLPNQEKLEDPRLYHYALFSDNVLAAAVVVRSIVTHAKEPSQHVLHIVTDRLNYAAMRMWFLANPPGEAAVQVQDIEDFSWLNSSYSPVLKQLGSPSMVDYYFRASYGNSDSNLKFRNPKYLSILNHLRFYLPQVFPNLSKVLFLDDDVVVQKDLAELWSVDLKGSVLGAVETCGENFHRFDRYLNFSNPLISMNFDPHACGWAFGMNIVDLEEWKRQNVTDVYHTWQDLNHDRLLWKLGTLPPGLITFWRRTFPLDRSWHVLGLGYNPDVSQKEIEQAAVLHYNGNMKPWLEIGIPKYRNFWANHVDYDHIFLRECNINP